MIRKTIRITRTVLRFLIPVLVSVICLGHVFSSPELLGAHNIGPVFATESQSGSWSEWIPSPDRIGALGILFWFLRGLLGAINEHLPTLVKAVVEISRRLRLLEREVIALREEFSVIDGIGNQTVSIKPTSDTHPIVLEK